MIIYHHQQVFSTGHWWWFEETTPGIYERRSSVPDPHYFHPQDGTEVCAKCGEGPHGLKELPVFLGKPTAEPPQSWEVWHRDGSRDAAWALERAAIMDELATANAPAPLPGSNSHICQDGGQCPLCLKPVVYDASEQDVVMEVFAHMLRSATKDGGRKRAAGTKPPWWRDGGHRAAIFSHLNKYEHGERIDRDSGVHPFVHLAWRALAIAYQETYGQVDPLRCTVCGGWIHSEGAFVGDGDGRGSRFAHLSCYRQRESGVAR